MTEIVPRGAAIVVLGPSALPLAGKLKSALPGSAIHGFARRVPDADVVFERTATHLADLFRADTPIVGLCSTGILIRSLAGALDDKRREPPVIAVAEDGGTIVPLLGAHRGGHALASAVAVATGGTVAVTSASEVRLGLALDEPPPGWRIANPEMVLPVSAALLAGEPVGLRIDAGSDEWLAPARQRLRGTGAFQIHITDRVPADRTTALVYHPPVLALGVGCERDTAPAELECLVLETLSLHGLAAEAIAAVVSIDLKADEPAVHGLARRLGVPARFFDAPRLEAERPRLANPSETVFRETGCHGVAEGAALAAAGPDGALIVEKAKSARATCAVARAVRDIAPDGIGRAQGRLAIVGLGPGTDAWRSPEASEVLLSATDIVGYSLYLDLLGPPRLAQIRHGSDIGQEEVRVRRALDLASDGRQVALVSSGDAGVYGLATLVFELLERENRAPWRQVAIEVVPGLSAMQAAAARAGAPLGHDFAVLSLSDLLTPWEEIERRLAAAVETDFVLCLYNPASLRRREPLNRTLTILRAHRAPGTPVVVARNLGRDGETVTTTTLGALDPAAIDMLSLVLIGSSRTRTVETVHRHWVYTPRGYARKHEAAHERSATAELPPRSRSRR